MRVLKLFLDPTHITSKWQTVASSPDSPPEVVTIPLGHTIFLIMHSLYYSGEHTCGFAGKKERERGKNPTRFPRLEVGLSSRNVCELNRWLLVGLTRHHSHKSVAPDYRLRGIARGLCIHRHIHPHLQTKYIVLIPRYVCDWWHELIHNCYWIHSRYSSLCIPQPRNIKSIIRIIWDEYFCYWKGIFSPTIQRFCS